MRSKTPVRLREGRVNYRIALRGGDPPNTTPRLRAARRHRAGPHSDPPDPLCITAARLILFMHFCKELWDATPSPGKQQAIKNPSNPVFWGIRVGGQRCTTRGGAPPPKLRSPTHIPAAAGPGWGKGRGCCHLPELPAPRVRMPALSLARGTCRSARAGDVTGGGPVKT